MNRFLKLTAVTAGVTLGLGTLVAFSTADEPALAETPSETVTVTVTTPETVSDVETVTPVTVTPAPEVENAPEERTVAPAKEKVATPAPVSPAALPVTPEAGDNWQGFLVGDVIVCPEGWTVSIDTTEDGTVWAACM